MKKILAALILSTTLSGCAAIAYVSSIWPKDHDPMMVGAYVSLSVSLDKASCSNKESLNDVRREADWLNRYTEFRDDPQKVSTKAILDNIDKAMAAEGATCQRWVNLSKTRMKIIQQAWSGR